MSDSARKYAPYLAVLIYALFAAWLTWPALGNLGKAIPGIDGDAFVHLWTYDWVKDALSSGQSPFYTDRLFYPQGVELYTHNFAWLNIAMWLPLQALVGGGAAYTLVYLIVLVLNGTAVYLLVRHLTDDEAASFIAGFIMTGWPYIITRFSQPNLIFIAFVPLALLAMHRLIRSRRWIDVLWLGAAVALIGFSRYQMLIMSVPVLVLSALYWLWQERGTGVAHTLVQLLAAAGLALLLLAPSAGPVIRFQMTRQFPDDIQRSEAEWGEADLLGFLLPGKGAPLIGAAAAERFPDLLTHTPVGWVTLGLALLGLFGPRRDKWLWFTMTLVLLLLALGRLLTINGQTSIVLPYAWLEDILLVVQLIRYPSRFTALLAVPLAVLAGYGTLLISGKLSPRGKWGMAGVLALLIALGYRVPDYPLLALETPGWYATVAADEEVYGLVTIPLTRTFDEYAMAYQLTHNKALVEGHVSRPPREAYAFLESTPFLNKLREAAPQPPQGDDISGQLRPLAENNLPYLVVHKRFLSPEQVSMWRRWLGVSPYYEDEELLVFRTALQAGEDYQAAKSGLRGLGFVSGRLFPERISVGDPLAGSLHVSLEPGTTHEGAVCYALTDLQGALVEEICRPFQFSAPLTEEAQLIRSTFALPLSQTPPTGSYQLAVRFLSGDGEESEPFALGPLYVTGEGRQFTAPQPQTVLSADLGQELRLIGLDGPRLDNQGLTMTLFWQAIREMDISYKFYIHVLDAASGELVGQVDTVPQDWSYPTNVWHAGEYVSDRLTVPVPGLSPGGAYRVEAGVYHPDTGERLPPVDSDGVLFVNNTIPLGEIKAAEGP